MIFNERELRMFALSRGGHQAVTHWIEYHAQIPCMHIQGVFDREKALRNCSVLRGYTQRECRAELSHTTITSALDILNGFPYRETFMYSIELEFSLGEAIQELNQPTERTELFRGDKGVARHKYWKRGASRRVYDILILRDPFNWTASRLMHKNDVLDNPKYIECYKSLCREILGETNVTEYQLIPILFNEWFLSAEYRAKIGEKFDLAPGCALPYNDIPWRGGGSSFNKFDYDGKANNMRVLERWQDPRVAKQLKELIEDKELTNMAIQIFGHLHPIETWIETIRDLP